MTIQETAVRQHFKQAASTWKDIYERTDVFALIHQQRREHVLSTVDSLQLESGSPVLDIGCGAGMMSVPLASRGLSVKAVDAVPEMIALTKRLASDTGVLANLETVLGDIHHLDSAPDSFQLVLAIGVLPWLSDPDTAIREIVRVLRPGGFLLITVDNPWGLHRILNPLTNFLLAPLRVAVGRLLRFLRLRTRERGVSTVLTSIRQLNSLLLANGLAPLRCRTIGFGPFCFFNAELLPSSLGTKVHYCLQKLCDSRIPIIRSLGAQYVVLAQKSELHRDNTEY